MPSLFALPVFFIVFREALETSIIVSVLLAFVKQTVSPIDHPQLHRRLVRQIWWGTALGASICLVIAGAMVGVFYKLGTNAWAGTEYIWEGVFAIIASVVITVVGAALLRISRLQEKWQVKMDAVLNSDEKKKRGSKFKSFCEKYALLILPFITILREGLEAIIFIAGVGLGLPATAFPLATICGILAGCLLGYAIYKGAGFTTTRVFLIASTTFLYLIAAGLFSKGVWLLEIHAWNKAIGGDAAESGAGAGSYDITKSVWHVNCCSPQIDGGGGWGVFNSILGWQNSATIGSVVSYNLYWLVIIAAFMAMRFRESRGHWPLMRKPTNAIAADKTSSDEEQGAMGVEKA